MLYLVETIIYISIMIALIIVYRLKKFNWAKISIIVATIIFALGIGTTFVVEKPVVQTVDTISYEVGVNEKLDQVIVKYHFMDISDKVKTEGEVNFNKVGSYKVKYIVPTILGNYTKEQTIEIVDTTAPTITLIGNETEEISYNQEYKEEGYTVTDNSNEDLQEAVTVTKEEVSNTEYKLVYTVEDSSHNIGSAERIVKLIDKVAPTIKLKGGSTVYIQLNEKYTEQGATATDEIDGDLTDKIQTSGKADTSKSGSYTITYTVKDNSENEAKKTRTVVVYDGSKPNVNTNAGSESGVIYLTFDDGPSSSITPKILDILKAKGVKATFFILNYSSANEKLVKREFNEGHTIGIHGYSHEYKEIYQSVDTYMQNITKLQEKIKKTTGYTSIYTRFPGGSSNTVSRKYCKGIMTVLTKEVVARGFKYFDWNVSSGDAGGAKTSQDVYNNVTKGLKHNRANMVLMHDFSGNTKTLNALSDIIDYGLKNGYTFSSINSSTPMITHGVNN